MSRHIRLSAATLLFVSLPGFAQYDYNDDFTKAVAAHYPPLVRLLITKGGKQNVQDAAGDTPLMQAIRSRDREITDLLMQYQPDLLLLNTGNHSAATEAVLADDADSLPAVLVRDDPLQVAQSLGLATKLNKRRVLNRFADLFGAPAVDEMGHRFLNSPLAYVEPGSRVAYAFSPAEDRPGVCAKPATKLLLQGNICKVDGNTVSVEWQLLSNLDNEDMHCSPQKRLHFARKQDANWSAKFLGSCGVAPEYFSNLPASFDYRQFIVPELR
ncbi:hypothetical protein R69608_04203 [Paraburkholderia nemoris]|uniref:ankyrin repeat domain-containing protein n=1 Tax=Paraburkholderia nemoris TaxID=2793076 RepID=UPI001912D797|nr:ankyrin repeat domain-containing protein [Paraburkholderia nemoris]MBK5151766.1 ankyrin repeat domain-containing protein [Burkholderia sp. R-69608]CAE6923007.1 hypothetical protein R69608_04203 [Paraburkholderia nemoris]